MVSHKSSFHVFVLLTLFSVMSHLFCRLLTVSIISLSVLTVCSISSFVLCSVYGTFIIRLQIHSNASSRRMSSFYRVHVSLPYNATLQTCFHHTFLQAKAEGSSHEVTFLVESLFFPNQFAFLYHDNFYSLHHHHVRLLKKLS